MSSSINARLLDYYVSGSREGGQLSPVRRFFCLFVTFDFLFTSLLWLICLVLSSHSLTAEIQNQVLNYSIQYSVFDVVLLAAARFVILILIYGLLHLNHWWAVALMTVSSSAFLVVKVFFYEWSKGEANSTFSVFLILCSFILSWGEIWLLDFRVIPRERLAADVTNSLLANERSPLLGNFTPSVDGRSAYYSPVATPPESDDEETSSAFVHKQGYNVKAKETKEIACNLISADDWQTETSKDGDVIYSKRSFNDKKIFKMVGTLLAPPKVVFEQLFLNIEDCPKWNRSLITCKILKTMDSNIDVVYQVAAEGGGGIVSSRDFVMLRIWEQRDNDYVTAGISINYPWMPPSKTYVRGENGPSAWIIKANSEDPGKCTFYWLLNTDLKGWLPQYIIDQALAGVMFDFMKHLRSHLSQLSSSV